MSITNAFIGYLRYRDVYKFYRYVQCSTIITDQFDEELSGDTVDGNQIRCNRDCRNYLHNSNQGLADKLTVLIVLSIPEWNKFVRDHTQAPGNYIYYVYVGDSMQVPEYDDNFKPTFHPGEYIGDEEEIMVNNNLYILDKVSEINDVFWDGDATVFGEILYYLSEGKHVPLELNNQVLRKSQINKQLNEWFNNNESDDESSVLISEPVKLEDEKSEVDEDQRILEALKHHHIQHPLSNFVILVVGRINFSVVDAFFELPPLNNGDFDAQMYFNFLKPTLRQALVELSRYIESFSNGKLDFDHVIFKLETNDPIYVQSADVAGLLLQRNHMSYPTHRIETKTVLSDAKMTLYRSLATLKEVITNRAGKKQRLNPLQLIDKYYNN